MNKPGLSRKYIALIIGVSALLVSSNSWATKRIQLEVVSPGGITSLSTNDNMCGSGESNGCIQMSHRTPDTIKYVLPASYGCGNGGHWEISGVQLAMDNKAWGTPLKRHVANDFDVDLQTGFINFIRNGVAVDVDNGNHSAYDIFYRVLATCTSADEPGEIELDPKIRNTG